LNLTFPISGICIKIILELLEAVITSDYYLPDFWHLMTSRPFITPFVSMSYWETVGQFAVSALLAPIFASTPLQKVLTEGCGPEGLGLLPNAVGDATALEGASVTGKLVGVAGATVAVGTIIEAVVNVQGVQLSVHVCPEESHLLFPIETR
jgi:hypothetical protein